MNKQAIRTPKGPAIIFLINAISFLTTLSSTFILTQSGITDANIDLPIIGVVRVLIMVAANLFMSIVLFSKKYNNTLIIATASLLIYNIIGLFLSVTPYTIIDSIFYLFLIAYTYIAINKQETPLREKVIKLRFIIPLFQFLLVTYSVVQTLQNTFAKALEIVSAYPAGSVSIIPLVLPMVFSSVLSFLPVLCYAWLVNWIADPYEKAQPKVQITD